MFLGPLLHGIASHWTTVVWAWGRIGIGRRWWRPYCMYRWSSCNELRTDPGTDTRKTSIYWSSANHKSQQPPLTILSDPEKGNSMLSRQTSAHKILHCLYSIVETSYDILLQACSLNPDLVSAGVMSKLISVCFWGLTIGTQQLFLVYYSRRLLTMSSGQWGSAR